MKTRILIVEDSRTQAERLRIVLDSEGYEAMIAPDGESALKRMEEGRFDLIISDIMMPGLSGYQLCQKIREDPKWKNTPVILLTTRKDPMDIIKGLECGADNFFTKPYDTDRLIERIRHILYNRELRQRGKLKLGIEVAFFGKVLTINSEKEQILDLLISTFEDIIQTNRDLEKSKEELAQAKAKLEEYAAKAEQRAVSSEERYRSIVEAMADGLLTLDSRGLVQSINPAAQKMFGYTQDEVIGKEIRLLLNGFVAKSGGVPIELEGRHKDGRSLPVSITVSETGSGANRTFVLIARDLTEEHKVEQQLRQAQKMEAIGQLTGGVAHDFNNLLTVIIGNSELLLEELKDQEHLASLAGMIGAAAERGAELTHRLLAFARRQALEPKAVDANQLVASVDQLLRRTLGEHIEIHFAPCPDLWPALADPGQLENALLNLCLNARDAMPNGGRLTIETANKTIDPDYAEHNPDVEPGDYVMLAISDEGVGMPPEVLEKLFEPFFTTKEKGKGTGLGLAMVYGFVKQSKGHIKVYSEVNEGTTVKLYFPRHCGEEGDRANLDKATSAIGGRETILFVEDNELVRAYGKGQLSLLGYTVLTANGGAEALKIISKHPEIDLLFTDIVMPGGMNGEELYREARRIRPDLKVLFASGYTESAVMHQGRLADEAQLLGKPYRRSELACKIRQVLDGPAPGDRRN